MAWARQAAQIIREYGASWAAIIYDRGGKPSLGVPFPLLLTETTVLHIVGRSISRILLLCALLPVLPVAAQQSGWRDAGSLPTPSASCADATMPTTALLSYTQPNDTVSVGSYAYDWTTGERKLLNDLPFARCNPANGMMYGQEGDAGASEVAATFLFSSRDPQPRRIAHMPTHLAKDGTLAVYSLENVLWASADGGVTWRERPLPATAAAMSMAVAAADGRALYLVARVEQADAGTSHYTVYFSPDAGASWQQRSSDVALSDFSHVPPTVSIDTFSSRATPIDLVQLYVSVSTSSRYSSTSILLSSDGGRTFRTAATSGAYERGQLLHTSAGIVRFSGTTSVDESGAQPRLERSTDGGATWQGLSLPFTVRNQPPVSNAIEQSDAVADALPTRIMRFGFRLTVA